MPEVPLPCRDKKAALDQAGAVLEALDEEWKHTEPKDSGAKSEYLGQRRKLQEDLAAAEASYTLCESLHTPPPEPMDPRLRVLRIEVVQSLQSMSNSLRLARGKAAVARVFVASGINNGYNAGVGPGYQAGVTGELRVTDPRSGVELFTGTLIGTSSIDAPPARTSQRGNASHSLNFWLPGEALATDHVTFEARVFVAGKEQLGGGWVATGSTTLALPDKRGPQIMQPLLIASTVAGTTAPSLQDFVRALQGARDRFPIRDFELAPPLVLSTDRDLSTRSGWSGLLHDISSWTGLASQIPGIVAGLVDAGPLRAAHGIGSQRHFFWNRPRLVSIPSATVLAHEMGHTYGLGHARFSGSEDHIDSRLPAEGRTNETGFHMSTGRAIPSGSPEIMGYDGADSWPCVATYDVFYNDMPI
ncbi:hypothetical protein [Streptomyces cyaneus]|uniref:hypothetical protein n=1 Tax=Streptomyces cyaneus TaxID=1904 RepID=UPI000FF88D80|nr:hypothetical protein [Streptomyces cyaneus]